MGMTFSPSVGMCMKVTFSLNRAGKRIRWAASKRLVPGSLLCISDDEFKTFKVVTVAARPLLGLEENPPELDIHFLPDEVEIDTSKTLVMIEARSSYFEAYKWVLKSLQRMHANQFPLKEQICFLDNEMTTPAYVRLNPTYNLTTVFPDTPDREELEEVNILKQWPKVSTSMDDTQLMALKSILTNPVSVIQGPPGTGKTYTSVMALNAILQNMTEDDPPIIVACQTNHALDQILRHILKFESNIVRLGGRTQDREEILARTLYHVRRKSVITVQNGYNRARTALNNVHTSITSAIDPLCADLINPKDLLALKLINKQQQESFTLGSQDWIQAHEEDKLQTPIASWLGEAVEPIPIEEDLCPEMEEGDVEYEMLKDLEAEFLGTGDAEEEIDALYGPFKSMKHNFRVRCPIGMPEKEILKASRTQNVWDIPEHIRPAVYTRWHKVATAKIYEKVRKLNMDNQKAVLDFKIAKMERDSAILSSAKLVGMTTTGLSKYRSLVASTRPKVVLIEEAAEALEGPTIIACMPTVQQLILVGDHKQLRGKCSVKELDDEPYNLNVSLFERWVLNEMPYITLRMQRRKLTHPRIRIIADSSRYATRDPRNSRSDLRRPASRPPLGHGPRTNPGHGHAQHVLELAHALRRHHVGHALAHEPPRSLHDQQILRVPNPQRHTALGHYHPYLLHRPALPHCQAPPQERKLPGHLHQDRNRRLLPRRRKRHHHALPRPLQLRPQHRLPQCLQPSLCRPIPRPARLLYLRQRKHAHLRRLALVGRREYPHR